MADVVEKKPKKLQKQDASWTAEEFLKFVVAGFVLVFTVFALVAQQYSAIIVLVYSFIGPIVLATDFVIMVVGLFLFGCNTKIMTKKLFFYASIMNVKSDPTFFGVPATFLCIPCVCLTILLKYNRLRLLFMLIGLQIIGIALQVSGNLIGTIYQPKFSNDTLKLDSTIPREYISNILFIFVNQYKNNSDYKSSLDKIQSNMECCGVYSWDDFEEIPDSCCPSLECEKNNSYKQGCLRVVQVDIAWHKNVTFSLTPITLLMYIFNAVMAIAVYVSYYVKWKRMGMQKYTD